MFVCDVTKARGLSALWMFGIISCLLPVFSIIVVFRPCNLISTPLVISMTKIKR